MLKKILPLLAAALLAGFALTASANEASLKKIVEAKFGKVESITKTSYLGLYEIYADGQIMYTDDKASVFILGNLVDGKTMKSVTEERMRKLTAIKFSDLPLERAIKQVHGDGKRLLVTFEDPNCGYCKRLAKDLAKLDNATIYTFLFPILSPDSVDKAKQIWCSADKAKAWNEQMDGKAPSGKSDCDNPVQKNVELGRKLAINGTPTLFFVDGDRIPGAVPLAQIEQKLNQAVAK
jgi:thiol:disulfide interchange protein DsbC